MNNPGTSLHLDWIENVTINLPAVNRRAATLPTKRAVKKQWQAAWLLRAVTCLDLTTLSGDDTSTNVQRLCYKAQHPIRGDLLEALGMENAGIQVGAVCVYPERVCDAVKCLAPKNSGSLAIPVASVATGFPAGQTPLETRIEEIKKAIKMGATEIDIVISRSKALHGDWEVVYNEVKLCKQVCGDQVHMKTILGTGDLGTLTNVYKASMVAMMAGSDFIKTSTGKEGVNATLPVGLVMVRAIRDYYHRTGYKIGFKPAGGIRSAKDACTWLALMKEELGDEWLRNDLFRIGASSLLIDIERQLYHHVYGRYAAAHQLPMA